jgi:hypothetical protein
VAPEIFWRFFLANQDTQAGQSGQSEVNANERFPSANAQSQKQTFRRIKDASRMVSELRDGDGIDPRIEHRKRQRSRMQEKPDYAAARLASQIARCINANLNCNPLSDFQVQNIVPGKGNSFVVTLSPVIPQLDYDPQIILRHATDMIPHFRAEIARTIHRKQVPNLRFLVAPSATSLEK